MTKSLGDLWLIRWGDGFFLRWLIITTDWSWWLCCLQCQVQLVSDNYRHHHLWALIFSWLVPSAAHTEHTHNPTVNKSSKHLQTLNLITLKSPCRLTWIFRYKFSRLRLRDENAQLSTLWATRNPPISRRFVCLPMFMSAGSFDLDKNVVFPLMKKPTEFLFFVP